MHLTRLGLLVAVCSTSLALTAPTLATATGGALPQAVGGPHQYVRAASTTSSPFHRFLTGRASRTGTHQRWRLWTDPDISERSGSAGAGWFGAYTANSTKRPRHFDAFAEESEPVQRWRLNAKGTEAETGGFSGDTVVFSQHRPRRPSNLRKCNVWGGCDGFPSTVNTADNEFLPTMTGQWLLFTRYDRVADTHRVLLFDRLTHRLRTLAEASGTRAAYAGQVLGDYATWYAVNRRHSNVFRYQISTRTTVRVPRASRFTRQYAPSVARDGTVYYVRRTGGTCGGGAQLARYSSDGRTSLLYDFRSNQDATRTYVLPQVKDHRVVYTLRRCGAPAYRATDVWGIVD